MTDTLLAVLNGLLQAGWTYSQILRKLPQILRHIVAGEPTDQILHELGVTVSENSVFVTSGPIFNAGALSKVGGWLRRKLEDFLLGRLIDAGMDPVEAADAIGSGNFSKIIQWVIDHAPQIYAWVAMILAFFGIPLPPLPPFQPAPEPTPPETPTA